MILPACTVRGCGLPLRRESNVLRCERGHSFDVARAGHVNLLQPQDKRSDTPGDSAEAVAARTRALAAGVGDELARTVIFLACEHAPAGRLAVLDVGCGEGFFLRRFAAVRESDGCGIDLSAFAAQAATRACPEAMIVIANADRSLPWPDATFHVVMSVTARRPAAEMRRVLRPDGVAVVAVPAEDDLIELREAVLGEGDRRDRLPALRAELAADFEEIAHRRARATMRLSADVLRDVLASTYRGARNSQRDRVDALTGCEVTVSHDVIALRPRRGEPAP